MRDAVVVGSAIVNQIADTAETPELTCSAPARSSKSLRW